MEQHNTAQHITAHHKSLYELTGNQLFLLLTVLTVLASPAVATPLPLLPTPARVCPHPGHVPAHPVTHILVPRSKYPPALAVHLPFRPSSLVRCPPSHTPLYEGAFTMLHPQLPQPIIDISIRKGKHSPATPQAVLPAPHI